MSQGEPKGSGASAAERFFRTYEVHCVAPNQDSLFNLLNSAHSLNDRLRKEFKADFFSVKEFAAIKALRNLFHHQDELLSEVQVVAAERLPAIATDLLFLCLVQRPLVERAIAGISSKYRSEQESLVRAALKWYGNVVNINPCIFNFAVHVHERVKSLGMQLDCPAHAAFKQSYDREERNGHSHFVSGDISCHAGSVEAVLKTVFADVV